jgi:hypothetical protein
MAGSAAGSPTASALTRIAAVRYRSSSAGVIVSALAMLSKPKSELSGGSRPVTSTSSDSKSRIALAYSVRLRRCSTNRPGLLACSAARSSVAAT